MEVRFPFEKRTSTIFGTVWRPVALVEFRSISDTEVWTTIRMIVDTGADYTLLPRSYARALGINLEQACQSFETLGIGGKEMVLVHPRVRVRLGEFEADVPVGFLDRDMVPALLGRQKFLEALSVTLENHTTILRTG